MKRKLPFWATFFTLLGVMVLCALGTWQLQRLEWKESILAAIEAGQSPDAQIGVFALPDFNDPQNEYKRGLVAGQYLAGKSFKIGPRTFKGSPGYHVITPFALERGGVVLVNRGWVGLGLDEDVTAPPSGARLGLNGIMRRPDTGNFFTPENQPKKDIWYKIENAEIENAKSVSGLPPMMLYAKNGEGVFEVSEIHKFPNNSHLQYALFWFSLAGVLAVIYGLRFLVRK